MAQANPFDQFDGQVTPVPVRQLQPIIGAVSPEEQARRDAAEARAEAEARRSEDAAARAARGEQRAQAEFEGTGGKPTEAQAKVSTLLTRIKGGVQDIMAVRSRNPEAQSPGFGETLVEGVMGQGIISRRVAGSDRRMVTDAQRDVLDAVLTLGTGAAYNKEQLEAETLAHFPQYGDTPEEIAMKNARLQRLIEAAKVQAGPKWAEIEEAIAPFMSQIEQPTSPLAQSSEGARELSGTGNFMTERDKELLARLTQAYNSGADLAALNAIAAEYGATFPAASQEELDRGRREGRGVTVTPTGVRSAASEFIGGMADSPVGAATIGAANALMMGGLDELAPILGADQATVQAAKEMLRERYPVSSFAGEVGGTAGQLALGGAGVRALGGGARALAGTEVAQGALYGAGESNDNRLAGGALGAGGALAGQQIGRMITSRLATPEAQQVVNRIADETGAPPEAVQQVITEAVDGASMRAPSVPGAAVEATAAPAAGDVTDVIRLAETASGRGRAAQRAQEQLAIVAKVNPEAKAAVDRLGIEVPLDVLSDDTRLLTATGLARSQPSSAAETEWLDVSRRVIGEADSTLAEIGASRDLAQLSLDVRTRLQANMDALEKAAQGPRDEVNAAINVRDLVEAPNMRAAIEGVIDDFGGIAQAKLSMTPEEKKLFAMLGTADKPKPATYAALNRIRDQIGRAIFKNEGPWTPVDKATLKRYYGALAQDQLQYIETVGGAELADKMRLSNDNFTKMYQVRDAMQSVFGAQLEKDIGGVIRGAITQGAKGEGKNLRTILNNVPKDMQPRALLTALMAEAEKGAASPYGGFSFKNYANLYRGLRQNAPIYAEIAKTIGPEKAQVLQDLYALSTRMAAAESKIIRTGKANNPVLNSLRAEGLVSQIAKGSVRAGGRVAGGVAGGAVAGPLGAVGGQEAGARIADALVSAGKNELDQMHALLSSENFRDLVVKVSTDENVTSAVSKVANDGPFRRYAQRALGLTTPTDRKNWLMRAIEAAPVAGATTQGRPEEQPTAIIEVR